MPNDSICLVLPDGVDTELDLVAEAWLSAGGSVHRLARFWEPPDELRSVDLCLYGADMFCQVLAHVLGVELRHPPDKALLELPSKWLGRELWTGSLADLETLPYPCFVKPVQPKQFTAGVHQDGSSLVKLIQDLPLDTEILISQPVALSAEARAFVFARQVLDLAIYEGEADLEQARAFAQQVARDSALGESYVLDIGLTRGQWIVIELNAAWGAGLNGCDAAEVLPAIAAASGWPSTS